jgi:pimeloyl-ACP methyl ester carboxylesterase
MNVMINLLTVLFAVLSLLLDRTHAAQWTPDEMNPGKLDPPRDAMSITPDCDGTCGYNVHYFVTKPRRLGPGSTPTILYISGGPGQIVDRNHPDLDAVKDNFNIVYFDIRGAGLSAPRNAVKNNDDKFLRAKYVVKDIEEIRKQVLRDKAWDAIYGHSAGTMFAQLYAEQFGKVTPTNPNARVKTLILSAPISRHIDNEPFRAALIATNLKNILMNNTDLECSWKQPGRSVTGAMLNRLMRAAARLLDFLSRKIPQEYE